MSYSKHALPIEYKINNIDKDKLVSLLNTMMRIRKFEESVGEMVLQNKVFTPCHLYTGEEAVATGVCLAIEKDDYMFSNHRSHGHYLAKGGNMQAAMAEIFCRATGCSKGRGGSMHLIDTEVGILGTISIVAGSIPLAVGTALADSIQDTKRVSVVFHGDTVPEEGVWHESLNFAALHKLPVIFICENNLYSCHMPLNERRASDNIPEIAKAHGLDSYSIDGNNVLEVYNLTRELVPKVRNGSGPVLIECRTYRWCGHCGPSTQIDQGLRSQEELDHWIQRCPISNYSSYLITEGIISKSDMDRMQTAIDNEVKEAISYAMASPYPDAADLKKYVFKGEI